MKSTAKEHAKEITRAFYTTTHTHETMICVFCSYAKRPGEKWKQLTAKELAETMRGLVGWMTCPSCRKKNRH